MTKWKWFALPLLTVAAVSMVTIAGGTAERPLAGALTAGSKAPSFTAKAIDDKTINFPADYKGKLVLVDFWATWCPPCRGEVPHLVEAYKELKGKNFAMIGVSLDKSRRRTVQQVKKFTEKSGMGWPQIYETGSGIASQYNVSSIPAPFLIDADTGKVVADGGTLRGANLTKTIKRYLKSKK